MYTKLREERCFYETLGFELHVDPAETYPEDQFAALAFGETGLCWQLETTDIDAVHARAIARGVHVIEPPTRQPWGRRTMTRGSPCGYRVGFEESAS